MRSNPYGTEPDKTHLGYSITLSSPTRTQPDFTPLLQQQQQQQKITIREATFQSPKKKTDVTYLFVIPIYRPTFWKAS